MKFKDKVVLITWASRWIWMATALHFWKEWASVIVNYLNSEEKANKVVENIEKLWWKAIAVKCDVSKEEEVINMINITIKTFWKIDILVNNAWVSNDSPILKKTVEQWKRTLDVNLLGTFLCSKYSIIEMLKSWKWKIINISSINWTKSFSPDEIDYDVSKSWIITLTKDFAKGFAPYIIVNAIAPWNTNTEITKFKSSEGDKKNIYINRFWNVNEIVKIILFLSGDDSSYINWTVIFADWWFSC